MKDVEKINQLSHRLESLSKRQDDFAREIEHLRYEINKLKSNPVTEGSVENGNIQTDRLDLSLPEKREELNNLKSKDSFNTNDQVYSKPERKKSNIEKFIGENLINKIGIAITVIGVAVGAKYSIEHDLINPLTRIVRGYLFGIILLGIGIKLKKKYINFSAVLVSGAMAIMYFITYAAYTMYNLMPQLLAFLLMLIFTVFTVAAALKYNRQVIAHIGLVGAYAVPLLLSDNSGQIAVFFTYVSIINIGILFISFKKYWKPLYYSSFALTWIIFLSWYCAKYDPTGDFKVALSFLIIFFVIFYLTFLSYKLIKKDKYGTSDVVLLLLNSFVFYGFGYALLYNHEPGKDLLGLFTLFNAIIHFVVSLIIYSQKLEDKNLFYMISGFVMVFIAIAIPVQLEGNWVTMLWAGEALLLFWIGKTKDALLYRKISYFLMLLAFFSIIKDWRLAYFKTQTGLMPFFNIYFLTSLLFAIVFGIITYFNTTPKSISNGETNVKAPALISFAIPVILIISIYFTFFTEIINYFNRIYSHDLLSGNSSIEFKPYIKNYKIIWLINYTLFFVSGLSLINIRKIKNKILANINLILNIIAVSIFITLGLYAVGELRDSYLNSTSDLQTVSVFNILIRYLSIAFSGLAFYASYKYISQGLINRNFGIFTEIFLHFSFVWLLSNEFINLAIIANYSGSYRLGLSILWGIYSLALVALGIWKKKKHLRISAIVLFAITLVKLFLYDISHLNTLSKTVIFISLGIILLTISFLYNKYKNVITNDNKL